MNRSCKLDATNFSDFLAVSRQRHNSCSAAWVSFCSSVLALGIGVLIWTRLQFFFYDDSGVYGWVAANHYPKQQELVAYIGSFLCIILGIPAGWLLWCSLASLYYRLRRSGVTISLSLSHVSIVFSGLPLAALLFVAHGTPLLPLAIVIITTLAVLTLCGTATLLKLGRCSIAAIKGIVAPREQRAGGLRRIMRSRLTTRWHLIFVRVATPILLYLYLYDGAALHRPLDLFHEGELLAPLNALVHGGFPYRDIYVQHGLVDVVKPWLLLSLGSTSLASLRLLDTILRPLTFVVLYFLGIRVFRSWLTAIALVLLAFSTTANIVVPSMDRSLLPLMSLTFLVYGIPRSYAANRVTPTPCFGIAGALSAFALFYSLDTGLYVLASSAVFLGLFTCRRPSLNAVDRFTPLTNYFRGVLVALLPVATFLWINGALGDMVKNSYIQGAYQIAAWGKPFPSLQQLHITSFSEVPQVAITFQSYSPVCMYLAAVGMMTVRAIRGNLWSSRRVAFMLPIVLFGIAQMRTALGRSSTVHLLYAILPVWILVLFFVENNILLFLKSAEQEWMVAGKAAFFLLLCVVILAPPGYLMVKVGLSHVTKVMRGGTVPKFYDTEWEPIGGVGIGQSQLAHLRRVVDAIQMNTSINDSIFDFSNSGAYYFLANRPSATRYHQVAYAVTPDLQRQVIDDLRRTDAKLVIYETGGRFDRPDGIPNSRRHPLLAEHIRARYQRRLNVDGTVLLLRNR